MNVPASPAAYRVGNFAAGQNIQEVSRQWIARPHDERFLDLAALRHAVRARAERSREDVIETRKVEIVAPEIRETANVARLSIGLPDGRTVAPTHWSFGQMASLAGAPAGYLRRLPSPIVADALTYGLRSSRQAEDVKLYSTDQEIRAATSSSYGRIFDADVVDPVMQIAGDGTGRDGFRWKIPGVLDWRSMRYDAEAPVTRDSTTLYASDRDVYLFLVDDRNPIEVGTLPGGDPDLVFRGFIVSNSEVGSGTARIKSFLLRGVCQNRNLWGVEGFQDISIRHTKSAPHRWIDEARPALLRYAEGSAKSIQDGVAAAKAAKVADDDDKAIEFLTARTFPRKAALSILEQHEREEGHPIRSAWDMAQGITAFARSIPYQDDRFATELVAGRILDAVS